jgi:hypothetical protein
MRALNPGETFETGRLSAPADAVAAYLAAVARSRAAPSFWH